MLVTRSLIRFASLAACVGLAVPAIAETTPEQPAVTTPGPATPNAPKKTPFPPIDQLMVMPGAAGKGQLVFQSRCTMCHIVNGKGYDFGPELSEIGNKLGKDGLLEAILDPSAGISHGYEGTEITLTSGRKLVGIVISDSDTEVTLRFKDSKPRDIPKTEIAERRVLEKSLMPEDVTKGMTTQNLVDLVTYLTTLQPPKAPESGKP